MENALENILFSTVSISVALSSAEHRGLLCAREIDIVSDMSKFTYTKQAGGFTTAELYNSKGDGFQIIVEAGNGHEIGDITN